MDTVSVCLSIFIKIVQKGEMVGICFFTLLFSLQIFPPLAYPLLAPRSLSFTVQIDTYQHHAEAINEVIEHTVYTSIEIQQR